jgi:hypothetical protein
MAAAIERTLGRLSEFDRAAMRQRIVERYGARSVADRLATLYVEVVEDAGGPAPASEAARADDTTPAHAELDRPIVVVGFDRARTLVKLAAMPAAIRSSVHVVTVPGDGSLPADLAGRHEPDLDLATRTLMAAKRRSPVRRLWYRVSDRSDEARRSRRRGYRIQAATTALTDVLGELGEDRPLVVPVDGLDHVVALATVLAGAATASPGGLRWLTDQGTVRSR